MNGEEALRKVGTLINSDREDDYGDPEVNFRRVAAFWGTYLGTVIRSGDVAAMMALFKIARLAQSVHHEDSWLDAAGYTTLGAALASDDNNEEEPA